MKEPSIEKIECPACGQHYSIELTDKRQDVTCQVCAAVFTVESIPENPPDAGQQPSKANVKPASGPRASIGLSDPKASSITKGSARLSILDRFMGLLFRFGKTFAGILAVLCLLAIFASIGVFVWNLHTSLNVPSYSDIAPSSATSDSPDTGGLDTRRAMEKQYGDRVAAIVKDYKFEQDDYYTILSMLSNIGPDHRSAFLKGLGKTLASRAAVPKTNDGETPTVQETTGRYMSAFSTAESQYASDQQEAKIIRWGALGAVFLFCFMLFMMLVIPALLRIEENTRRG